MSPQTILIVEDDPDLLRVVDKALTRAGYTTRCWTTGKDAHQLIRQFQPDLLILDLLLEDPHAGEMVLGLLELDPKTNGIPVIVCSGDLRMLQLQGERFRLKGHHVLEKPFALADLLAMVRRALA